MFRSFALTLTALTVVGVLAGLLALSDRQRNAAVAAERRALILARDVQRLRAIEEDAEAGDDAAALRGELRALRATVQGHVVALRDRGAAHRALDELVPALGRAIDRQLTAYLAGEVRLGDRIDDGEVEPLVVRVTRALDAVSTFERAEAERAARRQRVERHALAVVGAGLVLLLLATWQRSAARRTQQREARRFRALVEGSSDGVAVLSEDGLVRELTDAAARLVPALSVGTHFGRAVHPGDRGALDAAWRRLLDGHTPLRERFRSVHPDGTLDVEAVGTDLRGEPTVRGLVINLRDVSEQSALERELRALAYADPLTGLANRAALVEGIGALLAAEGDPVVLCFVDLDDFKAINDELGHQVGDHVLCAVGERLVAHLPEDALVARPGGDEFVVVQRCGDDAAAEALAASVLATTSEPVAVRGVELSVRVSVGVVVAGGDEDGDELLRRADIAMYAAKREGGGVARYRPVDDPRLADRLALSSELRRALDAGEEIELAFQPQVDLTTGAVLGVEALVRWRHPERGLVGPDQFVPIAESTGLMPALTRRVLGLALSTRAGWAHAGVDIPVAVNVSARDVTDPAFPRVVRDLLAAHGTPADRLRLEITETMLVGDSERAVAVVHELAEVGVEMALDDFGTGFSSLTRLRQLPLRELKVDRSFVGEMHRDAEAAAIVRSTVNLAHDLGLRIVAEGVESAEHERLLTALGCAVGQGYGIARPMPGADLVDWARARPIAVVKPALDPGLERLEVPAALVSLHARVLRVNRALATLLGATPEELAGRPVVDLTHPEDRPQTLHADLFAPTRKRLLHASGAGVPVERRVELVNGDDGAPMHLQVTYAPLEAVALPHAA